MSLPPGQPSLEARLRTMQIITFAIIAGATVFLAVALFLRLGGNPAPPADPPIVSYIALGFAAIQVLAYWFVPDYLAAGARRRIALGTWTPVPRRPQAGASMTDVERLWAVHQTRMIIGLALLEGATFFLLVAYLIEGNALAVVTAVVFILGMLMQFPTRIGVDRWVAEQQQWLLAERQRTGE